MFKDEKYLVGASNFFSSKQGSYAGEVNLESLKDMGINLVCDDFNYSVFTKEYMEAYFLKKDGVLYGLGFYG